MAVAPLAARPGLIAWLLIGLVRFYQHTFAYLLGGHCRFEPTCSHYAIAVLRSHGAFRGALRSVQRVSKCHPFHPGGFDPPPSLPSRQARPSPEPPSH